MIAQPSSERETPVLYWIRHLPRPRGRTETVTGWAGIQSVSEQGGFQYSTDGRKQLRLEEGSARSDILSEFSGTQSIKWSLAPNTLRYMGNRAQDIGRNPAAGHPAVPL